MPQNPFREWQPKSRPSAKNPLQYGDKVIYPRPIWDHEGTVVKDQDKYGNFLAVEKSGYIGPTLLRKRNINKDEVYKKICFPEECRDPSDTVFDALLSVGNTSYGLLDDSCHHSTNFFITGKFESPVVKNLALMLGSLSDEL